VWSARAAAPLAPGDRVRVAGLEGLTVTVEPRREES
jgi:membrane protein implicated in regulation of membrane protease activity